MAMQDRSRTKMRLQKLITWLEKGNCGDRLRTISIIGATAFCFGYIFSIIVGLWWPENGVAIATLVIVGLIVGFLNVASREVVPYLVAAVALVVIGNLQAFNPLNLVVDGLGDRVNEVVRMMATYTAPAGVIHAVRAGMLIAAPGEGSSEIVGHNK
ncbi:MAG: hypothetical protein Q7K03_07920 [Dehalococcoidia bacterium]|nr:hypothetical protein [Dehalococcoidia bacterium]